MKKHKNKMPAIKLPPTPVIEPPVLYIKSAGLFDGKWGIVLSNNMTLCGVEEIIQTKPSYSDGYWITAKIFVPFKTHPITKSI